MRDFHFLTPTSLPREITFKIRHTPDFFHATVEEVVDGAYQGEGGPQLLIRSSRPIHGVAPGQFCVVYDSEHRRCYGSGEIALSPLS